MSMRPIGTEYWHEWPPSKSSTESGARRTLFRVVAHTPDADGRPREEVKPVRSQTRPLVGLVFGAGPVYGPWEE